MPEKELSDWVQRIETLRVERGETRRQLARSVAMSMNAEEEHVYRRVSNWYARPDAQPDFDTITKVAEHYSTTADWIRQGGPRPDAEQSLYLDIQNELKRLSPAELRALLVGLRAQRAQ